MYFSLLLSLLLHWHHRLISEVSLPKVYFSLQSSSFHVSVRKCIHFSYALSPMSVKVGSFLGWVSEMAQCTFSHQSSSFAYREINSFLACEGVFFLLKLNRIDYILISMFMLSFRDGLSYFYHQFLIIALNPGKIITF